MLTATPQPTAFARSTPSAESAAMELDLPSHIAIVEVVEAFIGKAASACAFHAEAVQDVQTAVHEAVINAIVHGNRSDGSRRIVLRVAAGREMLEVTVQDEGQGFDASRVPDPLAPGNLSKPSGRGIFMMRRLMDAVAFRRAPDGRTEVAMLKRLPTQRRRLLADADYL